VTASSPRGPGRTEAADIVVVGAGLAGLAAARTLAGNGLDVLLLEGQDRVGGRVGTDVIDGWYADHGFQLLNPAYPALRRYVDVESLRLQPLGVGVVTRLGGDRRVLLADPLRHPETLRHLSRARGLLSPREVAALARYVARVSLLPPGRLESAPDVGWHAAFDRAGISGPLRRAVLEPFLTGTLADAEGTTSRRHVDLVLRSFVQAALTGPPGLPVGGMQAFADAVAAPVRERLRLSSPVSRVTSAGTGWLVAAADREISCRSVILATGAEVTARLLDRPPAAPARALTTFWHITDGPAAPTGLARFLHVDGTGAHRRRDGLVNTVVISRSAPSYVPAGTAADHQLVATTVLGARPEAEATARRQAGDVLGSDPGGWRLLTKHVIAWALPAALPPLPVRSPVDLGDGLVVVGDHRDTPSIQGALVSGRRGAQAALRHVFGPMHPSADEDYRFVPAAVSGAR